MNHKSVIKIDKDVSDELSELKYDMDVKSINLVLLELIKSYKKLHPDKERKERMSFEEGF